MQSVFTFVNIIFMKTVVKILIILQSYREQNIIHDL